VDPITASIAIEVVVGLGKSIRRAAVPLVGGLLASAVAAVVYFVSQREASIDDFFSAGAQVAVGVLVALVVELRASHVAAGDLAARQAREGTIALCAIAVGTALLGVLLSGAGDVSSIARGAAFSLTWGGMVAGVIGLLMFVGPGRDAAGAAP
jgi:hypothetical protein